MWIVLASALHPGILAELAELEFVADYGLFLAKAVTIVVAVIVVIVVIFGLSQRTRKTEKGHIEVRSLNDSIDDVTRALKHAILDQDAFKQEEKRRKKNDKSEKKARKSERKQGEERPRAYVVDFDVFFRYVSTKQQPGKKY